MRHLNKAISDGYRGKSLQMLRTFNVLFMYLDSSQMAQTGKRTIVHCPRGIPRHSEVLRGIYGCFPSVDSSGLSAEVTNLGEGYIYRESNRTKTQQNRSQSLQRSHSRQVNRQRSLGEDFLLTVRSYF